MAFANESSARCGGWTEAYQNARTELLGELDECADRRIGRWPLELRDLLLRYADPLCKLSLAQPEVIAQPPELDRDVEAAANVDRYAASTCSRSRWNISMLEVGLEPAFERLDSHGERFVLGITERLTPGAIGKVDQPAASFSRELSDVLHGIS